MEITFANNKYASNVKKTIKTDMALLLTESVESFCHRQSRHTHRL